MRPYVGMMVQYVQAGREDPMNGQKVHSAVVTAVYEDSDIHPEVDLTIFYHNYPSVVCQSKVRHLDVVGTNKGVEAGWRKPVITV